MAKNAHLTFDERQTIEVSLRDNLKFKEIGEILGKDPSTISKEVRNHYKIVEKSTYNPCANRRTPNAFSVENKDSSFNIVANSVGTATLNLRYDVPDGYIDPNNGCYSIKIKAVEEYANVQVNKLGEDEYDQDIIPGDSVSLKAKINTYYAEYGADYVKEMEHPILSYEWSLDSDYKGAATLTQDSSDPSKCTIKTTKALTESITVGVVVTYTDMYGNNQKEKTSYTLYLRNEKYKINCNVPEYGLYYIELNNATLFDSAYFKIYDERYYYGSDGFSYSPLNYIARAYSSNSLDAKTKNLFNALYWFEYQKQQL